MVVQERICVQHVGQALGTQLQGGVRAVGSAGQPVHGLLSESLPQGGGRVVRAQSRPYWSDAKGSQRQWPPQQSWVGWTMHPGMH